MLLVALLTAGLLAGGSLALAAMSRGYTFDWFAVTGSGGSGGNHSASGPLARATPSPLAAATFAAKAASESGQQTQQLYFPLLVR